MLGEKNNLEAEVNNLKRGLKIVAKFAFKILRTIGLKIAIPLILIIVLLAGIVYFITLDDVKYKPGDWSSVPFGASQYINGVTISPEGEIRTTLSAEEVWEKLEKNGGRVNEYLDQVSEFKKMMNAEIITQYPDTRANPDAPINWDEINKAYSIEEYERLSDTEKQEYDKTKNLVQGIIKFKRVDENQQEQRITYVDPATFQSYIDEYNETGSETAKQNALKHFTLQQFFSSGNAPTIEAGTEIILPEPMGKNKTYMGWQTITSPSSYQYKLREQAGMNFDEEGFARINGRYVIACTQTFGKTGDYIDFYNEDGTVFKCIIGDIKSSGDANWNPWGHVLSDGSVNVIEFIVNKDTWYSGGSGSHANPGTASCHPEWKVAQIKAINGGSYFDDPTFGADGNIEVTNTLDYIENSPSMKYSARIATWHEQIKKIETDDPEVEPMNETTYTMGSTSINYQAMVSGYTMPFDYLWTLLVAGEDKDFVLELADLVQNSELEITIYDNLTVVTTETVEDVQKTLTTTSKEVNTTTKNIDTHRDTNTYKYRTVYTEINKDNTIIQALTRANVWIVDYIKKYDYIKPAAEVQEGEENISTQKTSTSSSTTEKTTKTKTTTTIETMKYIESAVQDPIKEKTDPNDPENFVTLLRKNSNYRARRLIIEIREWLYEMLESNASTANMVDLTKYLLYKVTEKDYGVTEYDFSVYEPGNFINITPGLTGEGNQGIVDLALSKQGASYVYGATGPNTFDCSGLIYWVYKQNGYSVPRSTAGYGSYIGSAYEISWDQAQPGDILIIMGYERGTKDGHAGIYLGNNQYVHAPQTGDVVKISSGASEKFRHVFRMY